ncbi:hypothetical protein CKF54_00190 [Psittacicella hinzii]|uniref:Uncharacterized protein n=1 Tax=Psittacicella hinzii TaxID=2028575 RepID=A0A3A1YA67_9GAMM|nr:hypothetical protein [Psittacicella hinzii]RIY34575.1 hypothetical protein CKF54_00190 [Psittacicella hinzii]
MTDPQITRGVLPTEFDLSRDGDQVVYPHDYRQRQREVEVYALIPFDNDAVTLKLALNSLTPAVTKGVLVYPEMLPGVEADQSLEIATEFVTVNPGFKLVKYPMPIVPYHNSWIKDNFYSGGVSIYWLKHQLLNFGLVNLKALVKSNQDEDKAWLFLANPWTAYGQDELAKALSQVKEQNVEFDLFNFTSQSLALAHDKLFSQKKGIASLFSALGREQIYNATTLEKAQLETTSARANEELNIIARLANFEAFTTLVHRNEQEQVTKLELGTKLKAESQSCTSDLSLGTSLPWESSFAYHGAQALDKQESKLEEASKQQEASKLINADQVNFALTELAYPLVNRLAKHPQTQFDNLNFDPQELLNNSLYRIDQWINGFNIRASSTNLTKMDKYNLQEQSKLYQSYFNAYVFNPIVK